MRKTLPILLLFLFYPAYAQANSIKCVDSQGVTHYGDTIPPECANSTVIELDEKGMPIKQTPANLSPEERRAMEVEVQKQAAEAEHLKEQRRRDSALLSTYASEAEIDMARDRNVQQITLTLNSIDARLKSARERLSQFDAQAAGITRSGKAVPADLTQNINTAKTDVSDLEVELAQKKQDLAAMKAKYDADKKRYRELTKPPQQ